MLSIIRYIVRRIFRSCPSFFSGAGKFWSSHSEGVLFRFSICTEKKTNALSLVWDMVHMIVSQHRLSLLEPWLATNIGFQNDDLCFEGNLVCFLFSTRIENEWFAVSLVHNVCVLIKLMSLLYHQKMSRHKFWVWLMAFSFKKL